MEKALSLSGEDLKGMFTAATALVEGHAAEINSLNVFPVPDGDAGTNMLLTLRATLEEAHRTLEGSASAVAKAMARGALMGARGNSGVILSQILRGLAQGLEGKDRFVGDDLARALGEASTTAYNGVSRPVEGTILTVIRDAATAAQAKAATDADDVLDILEAAVTEARESVARTPSLLDVLREAGVVDAGGQGLYLVLQGALSYLRGEVDEKGYPLLAVAAPTPGLAITPKVEEPIYGYCTEFLLEGEGLNVEAMTEKLLGLGESVLVVGDETTVRVHLHTLDPGTTLSYATSLGTLRQVKVDNMEDQHREFLTAQAKKASPLGDVSIVAVVSGEGLSNVFTSLGTTAIVPGGQTMNPSVEELLRAAESVPSQKIILLPNNPNIVPAASQAQALAQKEVAVVPSESIPQGVTALLAFNYEASFEANAEAMEEALATVRTGEVTTAVRSMKWGSIRVKKGQAIGFLDGELVAAGDDRTQVLHELLDKVGLEEGGVITLYSGADVNPAEAEGSLESLRRRYPEQDIELVYGGQPHYSYILSLE